MHLSSSRARARVSAPQRTAPPVRGAIESMLARAPLLADLPRDALRRLAQRARRLRLRPREYLFRMRDPGNGLHVVVQGHVALIVHASSVKDHVLALRGPGDVIGEDLLALDARHAVSARAVGPVICVQVSRQAALQEIEHAPLLARRLLHRLSHGAWALERQLGSLGLQSGLERLASYLLRQIPPDRDGACDVSLHAPKWMVASMLDLTKESFSRLLRQLSDAGLIVSRGRTIHVPEPMRLAMLCSRGADCAGCWGCPRGEAWIA